MSKNEVNLNVVGGQQSPLYVYRPVILQSNMADEKNILSIDALSEDNRKYIIRWNFDLNGQTLEVGANCIIEFDGGSMSNGALTLDNTVIMSVLPMSDVLHNVTLENDYSMPYICELSKYEHDGAILPLNKVYVSYGLPVEQRTYVNMVGTSMHNNIVFVLSRGNEDNENFPYPNTMMVFTTLASDFNQYAYSATYGWEDAPEDIKRLFGWTEEPDADE